MEPIIRAYDIETSPRIVYAYGSDWEPKIIGRPLQTSKLLSISWSDIGEKKVHYKSLLDFPGYKPNNPNDKPLVEFTHKLLSDAPILLAHNGDSFDFRVLNERFMFYRLGPLPEKQHLDTKKLFKGIAATPSNSLDYLGNHYGLGGKSHHDYGLMVDCLEGKMEAWKTMAKYNPRDVELLKDLYLLVRPYAKTHADIGTTLDACKRCNNTLYIRRGTRRLRKGLMQDWQCKECGTFRRTKVAVTPA